MIDKVEEKNKFAEANKLRQAKRKFVPFQGTDEMKELYLGILFDLQIW